ncbi:hypothetical protein EYF80_060118 [Liparis tanakae]|uniref:Uncharacterized protein n=1 Tax=Liparis tanakae TaxID=230148 RepID=A0A4Z2EMD6_9TELE|nr:hypothetical protein EYF80_060118 [Liparis tanakae]
MGSLGGLNSSWYERPLGWWISLRRRERRRRTRSSYLPQILRTNRESSTANSITESRFSCLLSNKSSSCNAQTRGLLLRRD